MEPRLIPLTALEQQYLEAPDPVSQSLAAWAVLLARGEIGDVGSPLEMLPGRLTTVRDYARSILASTFGGAANAD